MVFKDNLNRICRLKNTTLTAVLKELGYSTSKVTAINNGSMPREHTLLELAEYLNCSVMDFFADDTDNIVQDDNEPMLINGYRRMTKSQQHRLISYYYAIVEGDVKNKEYQRKIIDTLVNSVYLYDGDNSRCIITFNLSEHNQTTLTSSDIERYGSLEGANPNPVFYTETVFGFVVCTGEAW